MRRIIIYIENEEFLIRILSFCEEEKITLLPISSLNDIDDDPFIVFITDKKDIISGNIENIIPENKICLITDEKISENICFLKENFNHTHLRILLDLVLHNTLLVNYTPALKPTFFHKEYVIGNDFFNINKLVYPMTSELLLFCKFYELEKIRIGMVEILINSIEHGNLEITSDEKCKATEEGKYFDLVKERLKDEKYINRKTTISIEIYNNILKIKITDEGNGFDTKNLPDPTDSDHILKLHGRGILIAKMYFTEIKYNQKGNEVTLIKELSQ